MSAFVVTALWQAHPETADEVAAVLLEMVEPSRAEPGCLAYEVHRGADDPCAFFLYERYTDASAYEAHQATPHFTALAEGRGIPLLESRERHYYAPLERQASA